MRIFGMILITVGAAIIVVFGVLTAGTVPGVDPVKEFIVALLVAPGHAEERPTETRVDLFDTKSNRTGSATIDEKSGRVDFYDRKSNRTGSGTIDKGGRIDLFDTRSNRVGSGQVAPGGSRGKR
jgi:hypothetical protein